LKAFIHLLLIFTLLGNTLLVAEETTTSSGTLVTEDFSHPGESKTKEGEELEKSGLQMLSLTLFAAAFVGTTYLVYCRSPKSVWIYVAAAVLYIGMEVFAFSDYEGASDLEMKYFEGQDQDRQKAAFEAAEKQTREAAESLEKRATYAKYAAMGFGAATAVALLEALEMFGMTSTCVASSGQISPEESFFSKLSSLFFSSAYAFKMSGPMMGVGLGLLGSGALYFFGEQLLKATGVSQKLLQSAYTRAALFGATALLATTVSSKMEEAAAMMKQRAEQYKYLKERVSGQIEAVVVAGARSDPQVVSMITKKDGKLLQTTAAANCYTGAAANLQLDANCDCKINNSCKVSEMSQISFPTAMPAEVASAVEQLGGAGTALFNGNGVASTLNGSSQLAAKAVKLDALRKKLEKKVNDKLAKQGKKGHDFDQLERQAMSGLVSNAKSAYRRLSSALQAELLNGTGAPSEQERKEVIPSTSAAVENLSTAIANPSAGNQDGEFKLNYNEPLAPPAPENVASGSKEDVKYDYNHGNDISNRKEDVIFDIISLRYLKTAYPILFEEKNNNNSSNDK